MEGGEKFGLLTAHEWYHHNSIVCLAISQALGEKGWTPLQGVKFLVSIDGKDGMDKLLVFVAISLSSAV